MRAFTVVLALVLAFAVAANAQEFQEQSWSWGSSAWSWSASWDSNWSSSLNYDYDCSAGECCWYDASQCIFDLDISDLLACDASDYECGCPLVIDYCNEALACYDDNGCDATDPIVGSGYTSLLDGLVAIGEEPYNCYSAADLLRDEEVELQADIAAQLADTSCMYDDECGYLTTDLCGDEQAIFSTGSPTYTDACEKAGRLRDVRYELNFLEYSTSSYVCYHWMIYPSVIHCVEGTCERFCGDYQPCDGWYLSDSDYDYDYYFNIDTLGTGECNTLNDVTFLDGYSGYYSAAHATTMSSCWITMACVLCFCAHMCLFF